MQLVLFATASLVLWLVLWAVGQKPMDAFIYGSLIMLVGITLHILKRYIPNQDA